MFTLFTFLPSLQKFTRSCLRFVLACSALCACLTSAPVHAFSAHQTDQAFAALLSLPGSGPESGTWDFPPAEDFEARTETALIAYLAKKQKAGADVNAYRHLGTLLHHAIRAGQIATAKWLLAHGADPRKTVLQGGEDALGLSVTYKRGELVKLLQSQYGMALPTLPSQPPRPAANPVGQLTLQDQLQALMYKTGRHTKDGKTTYAIPPEALRALWRKLDRPTSYVAEVAWADRIQPALWPELFASGYTEHRAEFALSCLLNELSAAEFKQLWPRLETHFTDIRQVAPRMILRAYRVAPLRHYCDYAVLEAAPKLQFLTQQGINVQVDALLARKLVSAPPALLEAMKPFTRTTFPKPIGAQPRLVQVEPNCKANLTQELSHELFTAAVVPQKAERYEGVNIESVQWIDLPGERNCALLVGGTSPIEPYIGGIGDTFTGPYNDPKASCPDPKARYEIWQQRGQKIIPLPTNMGQDDGDPGLIPVTDKVTGKRYYFHFGEQYGMCHSHDRPPFLLGWQSSATGLAFNIVESAELDNALYWQCSTKEGEGTQCQGIPATQRNAPAVDRPPKPEDAYTGMDLDRFLKTLRADHFERYQAAILALDKGTLKTLQAEGIPGSWTAEAILRLGKSTLPLAEKRRRIAWLFVDRAQLKRALDSSYDVADSLIDWLPLQDWRPVLDILGEDRRGGFDRRSWRGDAEKKGRKDLACAIDNAQGFLCGETIDASR